MGKKMKALVNIEFVYGCNNNCAMCVEVNKNNKPEFLTFTRLKKITDELKNVFNDDMHIKLFGIGNSLLHPEFAEFSKYIADRFRQSKLILSTNYRDLANKDSLEKINNASLDSVIISIQPGDVDCQKIVSACEALRGMKKAFRLSYICPSFADYKNEIVALVNIADLYDEPLIITRMITYSFGYREDFAPVKIDIPYDYNLQENTAEKAKTELGQEFYYKTIKGYINGVRLTPNKVPSVIYDVHGGLNLCLLRRSDAKTLKEYVRNYTSYMNNICKNCPVLKYDFTILMSKRPDIEPINMSCAGPGCFSPGHCGHCICPW